MNPVKRERIQQAVNRYKKFKDEVEHRKLKEEIERLMSLPWPFKVKTVEAARNKVLTNSKLLEKIYRVWYSDSIYIDLVRKLNLVEGIEIQLNDEEINFVASYEHQTL